jgi:hypothetical protein
MGRCLSPGKSREVPVEFGVVAIGLSSELTVEAEID